MSKSIKALLVVVLVAVALSVASPAFAAGSADIKPWCTPSSTFFDKLFKRCVEMAETPIVVQITIDEAKLKQAAIDAENWVRAQAGDDDASSYADGNAVHTATWFFYCGVNVADKNAEPKFDVMNRPVCQ
jgi:hypothetical protein